MIEKASDVGAGTLDVITCQIREKGPVPLLWQNKKGHIPTGSSVGSCFFPFFRPMCTEIYSP